MENLRSKRLAAFFQKGFLWGALCACTTVSRGALAQALEVLEVRNGPGFAYLPDASSAVACGPRVMAGKALALQVKTAQRALGLDVQLAIVLVTRPIGCEDLFYIPLQNDTYGIGYASTDGAEVFDEDPETRLDGIVFLNDFPYWAAQRDEFRTAFLHEVGHRWGARIGARRGSREFVLTGREGGHWSYFLDSGGSPLEGNAFVASAPLTAVPPAVSPEYSPLDLYLMGLIEPAEVGPIRLLLNGTADGTDCALHPVSAASPPQYCGTKDLKGEWIELGIDDVIEAEGPRVPASTETSRTVTAGVFVFGSGGEPWSAPACENLSAAIAQRFEDFAQATGGRLRLVNAIDGGLSCSALVEPSGTTEKASQGGGCSLSGGLGLSGRKWVYWVTGLFAVGLLGRLRLRGTKSLKD